MTTAKEFPLFFLITKKPSAGLQTKFLRVQNIARQTYQLITFFAQAPWFEKSLNYVAMQYQYNRLKQWFTCDLLAL